MCPFCEVCGSLNVPGVECKNCARTKKRKAMLIDEIDPHEDRFCLDCGKKLAKGSKGPRCLKCWRKTTVIKLW